LDNRPPDPQTDAMLESRTAITVRYAETDMMGIVYHGSYFPWFEVGRTTLLKEYGLPYRELEAQGYHLPVIELGTKFFKPALYDDVVTVITRLKERPILRINLEYEVRRGEELLVTGFTTHAFINRKGEPVRPPPDFASKMRAAFSQ
jgi:acyl-CoA thioester hydrolase